MEGKKNLFYQYYCLTNLYIKKRVKRQNEKIVKTGSKNISPAAQGGVLPPLAVWVQNIGGAAGLLERRLGCRDTKKVENC